MSADVPLLNDYKKNFVKRRLVQTFLGGLQLKRKNTPVWFIISQIILFLIPSLASIPFTIMVEHLEENATPK